MTTDQRDDALVEACLLALDQQPQESLRDDFTLAEVVRTVAPANATVAERRALFERVKSRLSPSQLLQPLTPLYQSPAALQRQAKPQQASETTTTTVMVPAGNVTPLQATLSTKTSSLLRGGGDGGGAAPAASAAAAGGAALSKQESESKVLLSTFDEIVSVMGDDHLTQSPNHRPRNHNRDDDDDEVHNVEEALPVPLFIRFAPRGSDVTPVWTQRPLALVKLIPSLLQVDPSAAAAAASTAALRQAMQQYLAAEKHLDAGKAWHEAPPLFEDASVEFLAVAKTLLESSSAAAPLSLRMWRTAVAMAANCTLRAADCLRYCTNPDSAATSLIKAAEVYAMLDGSRGEQPHNANYGANAAMECAKLAAVIARATGRLVKAAKLSRLGAEYAATCCCAIDAVKLLHFASALYLDANGSLSLVGESRAALARAAAIAVMDGSDLALAIDTLEQLADLSTRPEQPLVLFRAMLCRMASVPGVLGHDTTDAIEDVAEVLDQYSNVAPELCGGRENECLKAILRGQRECDALRVQEACKVYLDCHHGLEDWIEPLMRVIEERSVERQRQLEDAQKQV